MNRIAIFVLLILWVGKQGTAQTQDRIDPTDPKVMEWLEKGQASLLHKQFEKARRHFERALEIAPNHAQAMRHLSVAHELLGNFPEAAYMTDALLLQHPNYSRVLYFEAGMLHFRCGNYNRAIDLFMQFKELQQRPASDFRIWDDAEQKNEIRYIAEVDGQILSCRVAQEASKFSRVENVENLGPGINTPADEYFPCVSNDQTWMLFTTRRNRFADEDLHISFFAGEWMEGIPLPASFLSSHNEGMSTMVRNGRKMVFTACGRPAVKGSCDLWEAGLEGASVQKPSPMGDGLNSDFWDSQATISCDGRTIFFASNRDGGLGGTDIWMSRELEDGSWDEPKNMGPPINTPGDEEAPFITNDGKTLFFSSTGHNGLGEQDIFLSRLDEPTQTWSAPLNLGAPVNSSFRELGFFLTADGQTGYFASNRAGGYGGMDIYRFELPELLAGRPITFVEGQVLDSITWQPKEVTLFMAENGKVRTDEDGRFFFCMPVDSVFSITIVEPGYEVYYEEIRVPVWENRKPYPLSILLHPLEFLYTEEAGLISFSGPPGRQVSLSVFFDFDRSDMNAESIRQMEAFLDKLPEHASIQEVEIIGFSDQVGSEKYNLVLSENRAKNVALFLKDKGYHVDRLYIAGSGELIASIPEAEKRKVEIVFHLK